MISVDFIASLWRTTVVRTLLLPIFATFCLIAAVEIGVNGAWKPSFWQKSTWLLHDPYKGEPFDRVEVYERLISLEDSGPDIISVGDSSGFFSLQSTIVNRYTGSSRYLSLNTGANHAYDGYFGLAEYMLRRPHPPRYIVLYIFPHYVPSDILIGVADLAPILRESLVSTRAYLTPPSAFLSPYAKGLIFEGVRYHAGEPLVNHVPALQLRATVNDTLGWLPEFDIRTDRSGSSTPPFYPDRREGMGPYLGLTSRSSVESRLDELHRMIRSYGAEMVIAFAPVPDRYLLRGDTNRRDAELALERFQRQHPDVKFLFPFITPWGFEKFGVFNHISREFTFLSSRRLGEALQGLLRDPASIPQFRAKLYDPEPDQLMKVTPRGPHDPALVNAALALYMYAASAEPSDRGLISRRVLALLEQDRSFSFMMEDLRTRLTSLGSRNIRLEIDAAQIQARPVEVSGKVHCSSASDVKWVQLSGTMTFAYRSIQSVATEPVAWPAASSIVVPLVEEDGVLKFDGYCPEPSMSIAQQ